VLNGRSGDQRHRRNGSKEVILEGGDGDGGVRVEVEDLTMGGEGHEEEDGGMVGQEEWGEERVEGMGVWSMPSQSGGWPGGGLGEETKARIAPTARPPV